MNMLPTSPQPLCKHHFRSSYDYLPIFDNLGTMEVKKGLKLFGFQSLAGTQVPVGALQEPF